MDNDRFARSRALLGRAAMDRLSACHVLLVGVGGVGSYAAEALARGGLGGITLVDFDQIERSNVNRQLIALESTLGQYKVDVMAARIRDINPQICARALRLFYDSSNEMQVFDRTYDYVVDAIDKVGPKAELILKTKQMGISCISALGTGNRFDPARFEVTDIYKTEGCPLARDVRRTLRRLGVKEHTVLYSKELPKKPDMAGRTPGSTSFAPPVAGLLLAQHVILNLIGEC